MTATLNFIQCHPTDQTITIDGVTRVAKVSFDALDGYTEAQVINSLTQGELFANLMAGFIALSNPLADLATLTSMQQWQKDKLAKSGLLGPFTSNNRKQEPPQLLDSSDDGYYIAAVVGNLNLISILGAPARAIYCGGTGDIVVTPAKVGASNITFKAVPQGMVIPIKCSACIDSGTDATHLVFLK